MNTHNQPKLWSDFDGTAVEIVSKANPRNWSKYPLKGLDGYVEFLRGVQDGGVDFAGIVSRRPNIAPRRLATKLSVAKLGIDEFFRGEQQVVLTGNEHKKGTFVADQAADRVVGIIDDKPHKIGVAILNALKRPSVFRSTVVVGAVNHSKTQMYVEGLANAAVQHKTDALAAGVPAIDVEDRTDGGLILTGSNFDIHVVPVEPYSAEAGQAFAQTMLSIQR